MCINCTRNTAGINCVTCIDGFFRPKGVKYAFFFMKYYFGFFRLRCITGKNNCDCFFK